MPHRRSSARRLVVLLTLARCAAESIFLQPATVLDRRHVARPAFPRLLAASRLASEAREGRQTLRREHRDQATLVGKRLFGQDAVSSKYPGSAVHPPVDRPAPVRFEKRVGPAERLRAEEAAIGRKRAGVRAADDQVTRARPASAGMRAALACAWLPHRMNTDRLGALGDRGDAGVGDRLPPAPGVAAGLAVPRPSGCC